ncbi:hypothetical protein A33Q_3097 [Indibacter alkaliphilus LW1]|uniref:Sulfate ABC transporter permease n=1 Tax=Indibacter alkaliphilus (strain CCUG 57479 / KCTC 22604 / LW1) TaxID=1189612 RepID=S2DFB1_INDAL|nr:hypothetical protein [Indibacter alkaliphilus]EOZ95735.1 hypothetical protein A33Q_3097 [Indibacter alkaliphilus LW1]
MSKLHSPISQRLEMFLDFDKRLFFLIIVIFFLVIRIMTDNIILQSIPGYEELDEEGTFTYMYIFNALNYIWTPFSLLWKFTVTAFIIWTGSFAFGYKIDFKQIWQVVMVAELIFILPELLKFLLFLNPPADISFIEIKNYYPLSLLSLFETTDIEGKYLYPLRAINLFELIYIIFLVLGFHTISKRPIKESAWVITFSYTLCFLLWLLFYVLAYKG